MLKPMIGVIGAGACPEDVEDLAVEVGRAIAAAGCVLVCGGLGGVMEAAARGAKAAGGTTVGILPGPDTAGANASIDFPIATNVGHARNVIIVHTSAVLIAVSGGYGTLSEIALALKAGKRVVALRPRFSIPDVSVANNATEAVSLALRVIQQPRSLPEATE
ncbi:MAG: TIGR00725 family protein [Syntrophobacteraceae bacterium]